MQIDITGNSKHWHLNETRLKEAQTGGEPGATPTAQRVEY